LQGLTATQVGKINEILNNIEYSFQLFQQIAILYFLARAPEKNQVFFSSFFETTLPCAILSRFF